MQTILSEKKSDIGSPYVYYTVKVEPRNRQTNKVDMYVEFNGHLEYSSSTLYSGELECFIYFYELDSQGNKIGNTEQERSLYLKQNSERWSGTTNHKVYYTFTLDALPSSSKLGARFKVERYGGSAGQLNRIDVSNVNIPIGHEVPSDITHTITEINPLLTATGISNDVIVERLSQKQFTLTYTLHDSATATNFGIKNNNVQYLATTNPFTLDLSTITLEKDVSDITKISIKPIVKDDFNTTGVGDNYLYSYITYVPISITNSVTTARRDGQTSGKVKLNITGIFFNGIIGNVDQATSYKPTIKYKFWDTESSEPSTYANTISSSSITISNNEFIVSDYEIGSTTESATNYFNPNKAYRIKIYVEDNFTSNVSNELSIAKGYSIWSEYPTFVDFMAVTRNKKQIYPNVFETSEHVVGDYLGETLYSKTYSTTTSSGNNDIVLPTGVKLIEVIGITVQSSGNRTPLAYYHSSTDWCNWFFRQSNNAIVIRCGSTAGYGSTQFTIIYTKN